MKKTSIVILGGGFAGLSAAMCSILKADAPVPRLRVFVVLPVLADQVLARTGCQPNSYEKSTLKGGCE